MFMHPMFMLPAPPAIHAAVPSIHDAELTAAGPLAPCSEGVSGPLPLLEALNFCRSPADDHTPQPRFPVTSTTAAASGTTAAPQYTTVPSTITAAEYFCIWTNGAEEQAERSSAPDAQRRLAPPFVTVARITTGAYRGPKRIIAPAGSLRPRIERLDSS